LRVIDAVADTCIPVAVESIGQVNIRVEQFLVAQRETSEFGCDRDARVDLVAQHAIDQRQPFGTPDFRGFGQVLGRQSKLNALIRQTNARLEDQRVLRCEIVGVLQAGIGQAIR